jgi:hypothetical protein
MLKSPTKTPVATNLASGKPMIGSAKLPTAVSRQNGRPFVDPVIDTGSNQVSVAAPLGEEDKKSPAGVQTVTQPRPRVVPMVSGIVIPLSMEKLYFRKLTMFGIQSWPQAWNVALGNIPVANNANISRGQAFRGKWKRRMDTFTTRQSYT